MHSTLVRAQNVFGFFTTVAFVIAALIAASDYISPRTPSADISLKDVQVVRGRPHYYSTKREEYAIMKFSLESDLTSLFTWNTKQLFIYVSASWPSNSTVRQGEEDNEAVIWDTIITSPSADHLQNIGPVAMRKLKRSAEGKSIDPSRGLLRLKNQKAKYQITVPKGKIAETDGVVLKLEIGKWKTMKGGVSPPFSLPALKKKDETA